MFDLFLDVFDVASRFSRIFYVVYTFLLQTFLRSSVCVDVVDEMEIYLIFVLEIEVFSAFSSDLVHTALSVLRLRNERVFSNSRFFHIFMAALDKMLDDAHASIIILILIGIDNSAFGG
jgi:hypothetical protein